MPLTALLLLLNAPVAALQAAPPPPLPVRPPYSPTPLPAGAARVDVMGGACDDGVTAAGARYDDEVHPLGAGQVIWLTVSSPDFEPTLTVFEQGKASQPLAVVVAASNGRRSGLRFTAPRAGNYVFRTSAPSGKAGRWRLDYTYGDKPEIAFAEATPNFPPVVSCKAD